MATKNREMQNRSQDMQYNHKYENKQPCFPWCENQSF